MKFTDRSIQNLKPKAERYIVWKDHGNGLGIRVSPKGKRTFIHMYRFNGKPRMASLGNYPTLTLGEAHKKHGGSLELLSKGVDPANIEVRARAEAQRAPTIKALAGEYIEKWAKPRKRSWAEDERILNKDVIPEWGTHKAKDITRRDVIALLDEVAERAPIQANRTLATIRKMFNFALSRDIVPATPCAQVKPPALENKRDRILSDEEIRAFWILLDTAAAAGGGRADNGQFMKGDIPAVSPEVRLALKLQLVTGQRKGEVVVMEWSEISGRWWTIPREKAKNKEPHRVYLCDPAMEILEEAKTLAGESPYVFRAGKGRQGHLGETSPDHALRRILNGAAIASCTPHDLRRTAATRMGEAGVSRFILSKVLNHKDRTVTAIYDRHSYDREKQQAFETWGRSLTTLLTGEQSNVVALNRGAA